MFLILLSFVFEILFLSTIRFLRKIKVRERVGEAILNVEFTGKATELRIVAIYI